jgi:hypothetical protein
MHRRMREAGFSEEQADAITEEFTSIMTGTFATKTDLLELKAEIAGKLAELVGQIADVKSEVANLKISIADFKTGVTKWAVGIIATVLLGSAGISVAVVLSLGRLAG